MSISKWEAQQIFGYIAYCEDVECELNEPVIASIEGFAHYIKGAWCDPVSTPKEIWDWYFEDEEELLHHRAIYG